MRHSIVETCWFVWSLCNENKIEKHYQPWKSITCIVAFCNARQYLGTCPGSVPDQILMNQQLKLLSPQWNVAVVILELILFVMARCNNLSTSAINFSNQGITYVDQELFEGDWRVQLWIPMCQSWKLCCLKGSVFSNHFDGRTFQILMMLFYYYS
jgi:hypothetical protein